MGFKKLHVRPEWIIIAFLLGLLLARPANAVIPDIPPSVEIIKPLPEIHTPTLKTQKPLSKVVHVSVPSVPVSASCGSNPDMAYIYAHESGCCPTKWQGEYGACKSYHGVPTYGGYGLCQSTPPQKMATAGSDWATNWATQNKWCTSYANQRYGSPHLAYLHWLQFHNW